MSLEHAPRDADPLLDTAAAALELNCSKSFLEKGRVTGCGPEFVKLGGLVRYRRSALHRYVDECIKRSTTGARRRRSA
jgi:hypothetical protein